jgi:hypothetical protein
MPSASAAEAGENSRFAVGCEAHNREYRARPNAVMSVPTC